MVTSFTSLLFLTSLLLSSTSAYDPDDPDDGDDDGNSSFPTSIFFIFGLLFFLIFLIALIRIIRQWKYGETSMAGLYAAPVVVTTTTGNGTPRRPILRRPLPAPTIAVVEVVERPEGAPPTYEESVTVTEGFNYVSF